MDRPRTNSPFPDTIKKNVAHQQKLMQDLVDSTDAILYSVDLSGRITAFNKQANHAVRLRKGVDIQIGDHWLDIIDESTGLENSTLNMLLQKVLSGERHNTIVDILGKSGIKITYSVQASPIFDDTGAVNGAVLCAHDISILTNLQRDAAEKALSRAKELESWNKFYDMLLSVLAHDLRQPLSAIILTADVVLRAKKTLAEKDIKTLMEKLRDSSSKSIELLEGLLHWIKSQKEDFTHTPSPVTLSDLIHEANGLFLHDQQRKQVELNNDIPSDHIVYAHPQMLLFVCRNLIHNATKYAPANSIISVQSVKNDHEITISISDSGEGMSSEKLAQLFTIQKVDTNGRNRGAGMALAICHDMVNQMNGQIYAESKPQQGTTFYLKFNLPKL
ncbi:sensor histidine kinase [Sphingobacterium corticibacterium]|uniref:histidine kinase n=1 Tax=Sphingobacterium corticibacterium TaxID=2484746 RepID=A0A4Q6XNK8_9SPHI|nr:PAS domain-containing sensor histidine kinase [Sphingobacterium corticibacterium]RZF61501.1 PAS domain-containing sensor histidine kinase [Sphingobacterium corticibacterium]